MNVFAAATDAIFRDANMTVTAIYRPGGVGAGVAIRVIRTSPDRLGNFNEGRFVVESLSLGIRVADAPGLAAGDTIEIDAETFVLRGDPVRDAERLVWSAEARPE